MPTEAPACSSTATPTSERRPANADSDAEVRAPAIHGCVSVSDAWYVGCTNSSTSKLASRGMTRWKIARPLSCSLSRLPAAPRSRSQRPPPSAWWRSSTAACANSIVLKPIVASTCRGGSSLISTVIVLMLSPAGGVTTTARAIPGDWKSRRWLSSTASRVYSVPGCSSTPRRSVSSDIVRLPSNSTRPTRVIQRGSTSIFTGTVCDASGRGTVVSICTSP